jgi:hypothetical protein
MERHKTTREHPSGGAGMGLRLWRGADVRLNYERVVAKPSGEPVSNNMPLTQTILVKSMVQLPANPNAQHAIHSRARFHIQLTSA